MTDDTIPPEQDPPAAGPEAIAETLRAAGDVPSDPPSDRDLAGLPKNDKGNGDRLRARYGEEIRCVEEYAEKMHQAFLVWDQARGCWILKGGWARARMLAHDTAAAVKAEAAAIEAEPPVLEGLGKRKRRTAIARHKARIESLYKWAVASGNIGKSNAMLAAAAPYVLTNLADLDSHHDFLAVENGTLVLPTRAGDVTADPVLRPSRRGDLITRQATVAYDPAAQCPEFETFLQRILPDQEVRNFVQAWFGYCLTGHIDAQLLVCFYGLGANGKSTLLTILRGVFGELAETLPFASLMHNDKKSGGDTTPDLVRLPGARWVGVAEADAGQRLSEALVKRLTGGEPVEVRPLFMSMFVFLPTHKLVLSFNNKPRITSQDDGIWRRIAMVPFEVQIPAGERDEDLADRILEKERSGVLNWLLRGHGLWRLYGLEQPDAVREATQEYRSESDPIGAFLDAWVETAPGSIVTATRLWQAYSYWCKENAADPVSETLFGRLLTERGVKRQKAGVISRRGIQLKQWVIDQLDAPPADSGG